MTEVNPALVRYRRDRSRAFEESRARTSKMLRALLAKCTPLIETGDPEVAPAYPGALELVYDGGKAKQTLVFRLGERACKIALTPEGEERLRNEYKLLSGPFKGYEMFPEAFGVAYLDDDRVGGRHLGMSERFIEGRDILDHAEHRQSEGWPLSSWERFTLVLGMFDALSMVHRAGYVHRDPHPGNWIVSPAGRVALIDFGLAASVGECLGPLRGERVVSRGYEAPELRNLGIASCASDVYSAAKVAAKLVYDTRDVRALPHGAPFASFLRRCMAQDPARRFSNAYEARAALMALYRS